MHVVKLLILLQSQLRPNNYQLELILIFCLLTFVNQKNMNSIILDRLLIFQELTSKEIKYCHNCTPIRIRKEKL